MKKKYENREISKLLDFEIIKNADMEAAIFVS